MWETKLLESFLSNLYNLSLFPMIFLSFLFYFLLALGKFQKTKISKMKIGNYPFVSIHIPVYNDPVVDRCIDSCLKLDYPKNKYEIIVIDDSNDGITTKLVDKYKDKIKIIRRDERRGFKAGALNEALKYSRGSIIVVFDADSIPRKDFLKRVVPYFQDERVALVQTKQIYINKNLNIISKFAATLQSIYYNFLLKLESLINLTFCAGSSVAIRKDILEKFKWNEKSVTEDADISLKIFSAGYKTIYLDNLKTKSEVPFKLHSFLKQQARWTFGITRAYLDNFKSLLSSKLTLIQKTYLMLKFSLSLLSIFVTVFTFSGITLMMIGEPKPLTFDDFKTFSYTFFLTSGYLFLFLYAAKKEKIEIRDIITPVVLGLIDVLNNLIAATMAFSTEKFYWHKTEKLGNLAFYKGI